MQEVIIATYPQSPEAHLARLQLESQGIEAWIDNENFSTVYPLVMGTACGVQLKVRADDAADAAQFLHGLDQDARADQEASEHRCPQCLSDNIGPNSISRTWLILLSIATCGLFAPVFHRKHKCHFCGHRW
jgi:hypothetical protein